ncbi:MAG: hypothetical protein ACK4UQ_03560 [Brevundimonas sp.]
MISIPFAVLALLLSPLQAAPTPQQPDPTPAPVTTLPGGEVAAPVRAEAEPDTRRVCRFETVIGSNRRTRVCRDVPRQGTQDAQTREFMRDNQRVRMPDQ